MKYSLRTVAAGLGLAIVSSLGLAVPAQAATATPAVCTQLGTASINVTSRGPVVVNLQRCLDRLGAMPITADGYYGPNTAAAVLAFQGWQRISRVGVVGPITLARLAQATPVSMPAICGVVRVCVLLRSQVIFLHVASRVRVINTSTGSGRLYQRQQIVGGKSVGVFRNGVPVMDRAVTPTGIAYVCYKVNAVRVAPLGKLYKPNFVDFVGDGRGCTGYAIHGSASVPNTNESHGCMRVTLALTNTVYLYVRNHDKVNILAA